MTRSEIIALIVAKANEHGLVSWEFLGGAIAESGLNPEAWRQGAWPDWSAGLYQQTVYWADEGNRTWDDANVALIKRLYFDPVHACDVAARKFAAYRVKDGNPLDAWCHYNWPAKKPTENPNRANYERGLAEARKILEGDAMPTADDTDAILARVVELGRAEIGKPYTGPIVGMADSTRYGSPGFDCSSFVSEMFKRATNGQVKLTPFTDAAHDQCEWAQTPRPGMPVFYHYADGSQPGVTFPHMGIWLSATEVLDCRYSDTPSKGGVGIRKHVTPIQGADGRYRVTMLPNGLAAVTATPSPPPAPPPAPPPVDPLASWIESLAYIGDDIGDDLDALPARLRAAADTIERSVDELRRVRRDLVGPRPAA